MPSDNRKVPFSHFVMTSWKDLAHNHSEEYDRTFESGVGTISINYNVDSQGDNVKLSDNENASYFEIAGMLVGISG